jgi:hypothetical protein
MIGRSKLRVGADMIATAGKIDDPLGDPDEDEGTGRPGRTAIQNPLYRSAAARNVIGAYGELSQPLAARVTLDLGLRGDLWITGSDTQAALEPRGVLRYQVSEAHTLHAAFGLAYQPAVFLLPIPGLSDVALDRGLQRAMQVEVGTRNELGTSFTVEVKGFAHLYDNLLAFEAIESEEVECTPTEASPTGRDMEQGTDQTPEVVDVRCEEESGFARMRARSMGGELLLRRDARERISGWLSYTLSKAWGETTSGRPITPSFDVRHVANLVSQWRISEHWHVALRGYVASGRYPYDASIEASPRARRRLPPFYRGDLQLSRLWPRPWGQLRFSFEWLNFTFRRDPQGWACDGEGECRVEYTEFPITIPMLGVRGTY